MFKRIFIMTIVVMQTVFGWTEIANVKGVKWTYKVSNGKASVGLGLGGRWEERLALSKSTSGEIKIPSFLGGYPVRSLSDASFRKCEFITRVIIPNTVTSIGSQAFDRCKSLTQVVIPNSVKSIGYRAFIDCCSLESVVIPNSVTEVASSVFIGCDRLVNLTIPQSMCGASLRKYGININKIRHLVISKGTMSIEEEMLRNCSNLETISIPDSVVLIGRYAFQNCKKLQTIQLPNQLKNINVGLFSGCSSIESVIIPQGVTNIGENAFADCSELRSVSIPDSVISIGRGAFKNCKKLHTIKLPSQLKDITENLFYGCSSIESVAIPCGVTNIKYNAFSDCSSLKSIFIPDSVFKIESSAFDESCKIVRSASFNIMSRQNYVREVAELFQKECSVSSECAEIQYYGVHYILLKDKRGIDSFVVLSQENNPNNEAYSFITTIFPNFSYIWYDAVEKSINKLINWIDISVKNKVKQVDKEMPIYQDGGVDFVYFNSNGITSGIGQKQLMQKAIREPFNIPAKELAIFRGFIEAINDDFTKFEISLTMKCGNNFNHTIFHSVGSKEEIEKDVIKFLMFVNPKKLKEARDAYSKKADLFN